jgi:hypothetical protein
VAWTPKVLSEFEIGQASAAIEAVGRQGKPIAEVGCRAAAREDIEHDLRANLADRREANRVFVWIRPAGDRFRFGYYSEAWTQSALDFLERANVEDSDRHWISGLLFGYQPSAIQEFIDAGQAPVALASGSTRQPIRRPSSGRTSHLHGIPARSRT